jgi:DNA polymerase III subunit alpha
MHHTTYVPLRTHSPYSIAEGAAWPKELAQWAKANTVPAVGVADTSSLAGVFSIKESLVKSGVQPLQGVQLSVRHAAAEGVGDETSTLVLYARSEKGFGAICKLLSKAMLDDGSIPLKALADPEATEDCWVLTGGKNGPVDKALALRTGGKDKAATRLKSLHAMLGNKLWVELQRQTPQDIPRTQTLANLATTAGIPVVATHEAWYTTPDFKEAHDALLCIAQNLTIDHQDRRKTDPAGHLLTPADMRALFADVEDAVDATLTFAQQCNWVAKEHKPMLPAFPGLATDESTALYTWAREGLAKRLETVEFDAETGRTAHGHDRQTYLDRLEYELGVIASMGFPGYFLIVSDFIQWSKDNGIPVGPGRGSGAGSIVAWALRITDLDPLRYGLYFERFLNPERVSMPDFDIDFCQERREKVIQYVKDRYGNSRVSQIGTYGKLQARAVLRAAGRVLQIPYPVVDRYSKMIPNNPAHPTSLPDAMAMEPLASAIAQADPNILRMFAIAQKLEGLYAHASTHAAGVVIGDRPIGDIVPVFKDDHGATVTGYDMKAVEKAGLVKFDFLGLKTLDIIEGTIGMAEKMGHSIDLDRIGTEDPDTYAMLRKGDAFGVFQLESAGMRKAMLQIQPTCIEDIIALVALYRPGPMENIPHYAAVKQGEMDAEYLHPLMRETLAETHGIIVYQEQVMKLAQDMAGYSLGGADLLRRAMGKKIKAEMDAQEAVFRKGAAANGIDEAVAKETFDLIAKFANYGFNKSHAAAYAVISYQTAYLRCHHREAFMAATMNLDLSNVDAIAEALEDARRTQVRTLPPHINRSEALFHIEDDGGWCIRHGMAALRGVGLTMARAIEAERKANGPFRNLSDLAKRCGGHINKKAMESLVSSGACDVFNPNRAALTAAIPDALKTAQGEARDKAKGQGSLFGDLVATPIQDSLPSVAAWDRETTLAKQYDVVGFFLDGHPLEELRSTINRRNNAYTIRAILQSDDWMPKEIVVGAYILDSTFRKTRAGKPMVVLRICDETGMMEALAFEDTVDLIQSKLPKPIGARVCLTVSPAGDANDPTLFIRDIEHLDVR